MLSLARILARTGNYSEAVTLHRKIAVRTERLPLYLMPFADDLWLADMRQEAIAIGEEIVTALPTVAHCQTWFAAMLWKHGARSAAIDHQRSAVALCPTNRRYRLRLYTYRIAGLGWWLRFLPRLAGAKRRIAAPSNDSQGFADGALDTERL